MNKQTFLFDTICDDLVEKILEHKKINKEIKMNKSRATEGVSLELKHVYHYMWNKYDEFKCLSYWKFINEEFTVKWHLTAIKNLKILETDSSEEELEYESESD
jgi:hypothetical protein